MERRRCDNNVSLLILLGIYGNRGTKSKYDRVEAPLMGWVKANFDCSLSHGVGVVVFS